MNTQRIIQQAKELSQTNMGMATMLLMQIGVSLNDAARFLLACKRRARLARVLPGVDHFSLRDGSSIVAQYDENSHPVAMIEVAA
jgi:hypothetical protein